MVTEHRSEAARRQGKTAHSSGVHENPPLETAQMSHRRLAEYYAVMKMKEPRPGCVSQP